MHSRCRSRAELYIFVRAPTVKQACDDGMPHVVVRAALEVQGLVVRVWIKPSQPVQGPVWIPQLAVVG
jgi:hypothetical protein